MERIADPELDKVILDHLTEQYQLQQTRPPGEFHLSTGVYCLTRGYLEATSPIAPTEEETLLFTVGLGLQAILTPKQSSTPTFMMDGVIYRPDFVLKAGADEYHELKTTRMSLKNVVKELPESWVEYIAGGCFIRSVNTYKLSILCLMGNYAPPFPKLYSETLVFEQDELSRNWDNILDRKYVYSKAIKTHTPPTPFEYCKEWECKNCRYRLVCDAIVFMSKREQVEKDIRELF